MSDVDPEQLKHAADPQAWAGLWQWLSASLAAALGTVGGFVFRDHNRRLQQVEEMHKKTATLTDIKDLHVKLDAHMKEQADKSAQVAEKLGTLGANVESISSKTDKVLDALLNRSHKSRSEDK